MRFFLPVVGVYKKFVQLGAIMLGYKKAGKWIRLMIVLSMLLISLSAASAFQHTSKDLYRNFALENYPVFETDNITLRYVSLPKGGIFIPPKLILIDNGFWYQHNSSMHRGIIEHELIHYYCWREFKDMDWRHIRCFSPDYNLKKSMY